MRKWHQKTYQEHANVEGQAVPARSGSLAISIYSAGPRSSVARPYRCEGRLRDTIRVCALATSRRRCDTLGAWNFLRLPPEGFWGRHRVPNQGWP